MTPEEMLDLLCEYPQMKVTHTIHDPDVYDGDCKYTLTLSGYIVGSELVAPWFVREYIERNIATRIMVIRKDVNNNVNA